SLTARLLTRDLHLDRVVDAPTAEGDREILSGARSDAGDDVPEIFDRRALDCDDLISGFEPRAGGRTIRHHLTQEGRNGRRPELKTKAPEELRRLGQAAALIGIRHTQGHRALIARGPAKRQYSLTAGTYRIKQLEDDIPLPAHRHTVDGPNLI